MQITMIGLDIAKNVFQVHGIDGDENIVFAKCANLMTLLVRAISLARTGTKGEGGENVCN
jgi:hypothetical protein